MQNNENGMKPSEQLVDAQNNVQPGQEVTLEQLESLCYTFGRRPRGCTGFTSVGDNDDILF